MNPYIALTRPGNAVLTAIAVIAGAFIASGPEIVDYWEEIAICCISAMMLVGGGNALNDYNDRETDKENHPNRPIPSGEISAETALNYSNILLGAGLVILWFTLANWMVFIIALMGVLTLIAYENGLKAAGLAGNIAVGFMSGAVFLYAGMAFMGLGMGLASPGYTSAASLNADKDKQGAAVGLAMVAPGIGFALGPLLSGFLYSSSMNLPFIFILPLFSIIIVFIRKLEQIN